MMETQTGVAHSQKQSNVHKKQSTTFLKMKEHLELIAAIVSGILILGGWIFAKYNLEITSIIFYLLAFTIGGYAKAKEGIEETIENKELNVEMLMIFAAIGSAVIGYWTEGAILIFIFALSGALETYTLNKSQKEISSLMDLQPNEALLLTNQGEKLIHVSELKVKDRILVKPGERVPSDGKIIHGKTTIDEAAITGESMPVSKQLTDEVFAGTVNLNGAITVEITKPNEETLFQKIIQLVQNAQSEKSPSQLFIERFEGTYVKCVLLAVLLMMSVPPFLLDWSWTESIYRGMVLLVVASPCALVASIMPATLSAISNGARHGILFKGGIHLEQLAGIKAIAFDKTGTLTKGKPVVTETFIREDLVEEEFHQLIASVERNSNHPLGKAIVGYVSNKYSHSFYTIDSLEDVVGSGLKAIIREKEYLIGKPEFVGRQEAETFHHGIADKLSKEGKTLVFVRDEHGIAGLYALKDEVRPETKRAIEALKRAGIYTVMMTGDHHKTAEAIAKESGIDHFVAECLPETKVNLVKDLKKTFGNVAMVGDGINDAPALASANIGIAMGEGTDVALETADVVLMKNDLEKIANSIQLSNRMNRVMRQNIIFSITVIMLLISANFLQSLDLPLGVIGHEGSTILVILNGLRLLK